MKIYALGDLHLGFESNKPMDRFGDQWINHSQQIEYNWRRKITSEDYILIPGDLSWAMRFEEARADLDWLDSLPGKKICIKGNHDYWWDRPKKLNEAYKDIVFLQNTAYFIEEIAICGTRGWTCPNPLLFTEEDARLYEREVRRLELSLKAAKGASEIWVMLHYPPTHANEHTSPLVKLLSQYPVTKVVYGHLHDELSWQQSLMGVYNGISYELVSADYLKFDPLYLGERSDGVAR